VERFGSKFHEVEDVLSGSGLGDLDVACEDFPDADGLVGRESCGRFGLDHDLTGIVSDWFA